MIDLIIVYAAACGAAILMGWVAARWGGKEERRNSMEQAWPNPCRRCRWVGTVQIPDDRQAEQIVDVFSCTDGYVVLRHARNQTCAISADTISQWDSITVEHRGWLFKALFLVLLTLDQPVVGGSVHETPLDDDGRW